MGMKLTACSSGGACSHKRQVVFDRHAHGIARDARTGQIMIDDVLSFLREKGLSDDDVAEFKQMLGDVDEEPEGALDARLSASERISYRAAFRAGQALMMVYERRGRQRPVTTDAAFRERYPNAPLADHESPFWMPAASGKRKRPVAQDAASAKGFASRFPNADAHNVG